MFDINRLASGLEEQGIYPGCGSACPLLNRPCNYGECIDKYDDFKCNCTVSPFDGQYCQNGKCLIYLLVASTFQYQLERF